MNIGTLGQPNVVTIQHQGRAHKLIDHGYHKLYLLYNFMQGTILYKLFSFNRYHTASAK